MGTAVKLDVFIEQGCRQCERALQLAGEVDGAYPNCSVAVIDVSKTPQRPAGVFAVPTFVVNGDVFSLGNPKLADLQRAIERLLEAEVD